MTSYSNRTEHNPTCLMCSWEEGHLDTQTHGRQRLEGCFSKPENAKDHQQPAETRGRKIGSPSRVFREKPVLLTPWLRTSSLQNSRNTFLLLQATQFLILCYMEAGSSSLLALWGPSQLTGSWIRFWPWVHPHWVVLHIVDTTPIPVPESPGPQCRSRLCACFAFPRSQIIRATALQATTFPELANYL